MSNLIQRVNKAEVQQVPLSKIVIGERRREKKNVLKDLQILKKSIEELGVIHPIILDEDFNLAAGNRRFKACERLQLKTIPARVVKLTEEELRSIELDENEARSDLDQYEASSTRMRELDDIIEAKNAKYLADQGVSGKSALKRQIPAKVAERHRKEAQKESGQHKRSVDRDRAVVKAVREHPFMERWTQRAIAEATASFKEMGTTQRKRVCDVFEAMTDVFGPKATCGEVHNVLECVHEIEPKYYAKIAQQCRSKDPEIRRFGATNALRLPPVPDDRVGKIRTARDAVAAALKPAKYKGDDAHGYLIEARDALTAASKAIDAAFKVLRDEFYANIEERE